MGLYLRYDSYKNKHPDNDELFQLKTILDVRLSRVFDNKQMYGDHTSFPGEFLLYNIPIRLLRIQDADIDIESHRITGMGIDDFWKLASVKIVITVLGFVCHCPGFLIMCLSS